jgi:hypothetical protein
VRDATENGRKMTRSRCSHLSVRNKRYPRMNERRKARHWKQTCLGPDHRRRRRKAGELSRERVAFEQRLERLSDCSSERTACVEALARTAASARIRFKEATVEEQREVLTGVLSNATLRDQEIADYQLKSPFDVLVKDAQGALILQKWR